MNSVRLPDDSAKQWEILMLLLSSEEKKIDRTSDSEIDTMNYFCKNEGVNKIMLQWLQQMHASYAKKLNVSDTALKCDEVSLLWRQRGNDKFRGNFVAESYKCYSKSVLYAHQNGPMYPLALANRSAALLRLKKFQECLQDIELALTNGYPNEQRHKLLLRRADCHIELNQQSHAKQALEAATEYALSLNLNEAHTLEFDRHIKILDKKLEAIMGEDESVEEVVLPECYLGNNENFHNASKAALLRRNDSAGRHVIVTETTRRGDVIFSEEPYAWVTLPTGGAVCDMCCAIDISPVPCTECSRSVYCGHSCRARGYEYFHRWECVGGRAHLFPTIGIAHLALRVLLISAYHGFPNTPSPLSSQTTAADLFQSYSNVDNVNVYHRDVHPFYRMFNLVTNFEKMNNTDYIQYALTATTLVLYLEHFTSFFEYLPTRLPYSLSAEQLRLFAAGVILRGLGQLVCNGHAALSLSTVEEDDGIHGRTRTEREVRRATAIYPSAAMMNHSCDPNIVNTFHNSRLIVRCSRELTPGTEVLNCYGPHKAREPTSHRRAQLRAQYMFACECDACVNPESKDFVQLFTAYACQSCKGPVLWNVRANCSQCRAEFHMDRAIAAIERADGMLVQAERATTIVERCEKTHASFRMKQQVWHRHHTSLRAAADRLARLYTDVGEFSKSMELIKQNIQSLEYQFGSFSVEVAHELRKLSDVMLERIINSPQNPDYREWCLETHKIIKKSVQLMELNYGSWEPLVKRLREQETFVASLLADSRTPETSESVHHNLHYNLKI